MIWTSRAVYAGCGPAPRSGVQRCGVHPSAIPATTRRALVAGAVAVLAAACSAGGSERACGEVEREPLDPSYLIHVLGSATDASYTSDPPTSGPHQPAPAVEGVLDAPITKPVQVGVLERGDVLLQHLPGLGADELDELRALAGDRVVVAPNPDLPSAIVATAWTHVRHCTAVDVGALRAFIRERAGNGPEGG